MHSCVCKNGSDMQDDEQISDMCISLPQNTSKLIKVNKKCIKVYTVK